ncbi:MAG TPA: hypothetical protein PLX33_02615 [Alphaproteobacteria bacterium]|nr:hypothetical protein [Alphaproteobacteria bacterium]
MAVLSQPTSPENLKLTPRTFVKDVVLDPGIVFGVADVLMFAKTNPVGFIACLGATGVSVGLKTLHLAQPKFLKNYTRVADIAGDSRTALRASGLALLVVAGTAVSGGTALPATASFLLAVGNFRLAQSLSDAMEANRIAKEKEAARQKQLENGGIVIEFSPAPAPAAKQGWLEKTKQIAVLSVKRPDLYINAGFACAGLMAGGASLFVLPLVAIAFTVSMKNIIQNKAEHQGHPKLMTAGAGFSFTGIGVAEGHGLIAAAHAINATIMADAERRVTPGGWRAIAENIRSGIAKALRLDKPQKPEPVDHPIPVPFDAHDLGEDKPHPLPEPGKLKQHFNIPVPEHKPEAKPAAAQNDNAATLPVPDNDNAAPRAQIPPKAAPRR